MACCCVIFCLCMCFFFNQKWAYDMRIRDWISDVFSSDLVVLTNAGEPSLRQVSRRLGARAIGAVQTLSRGTKLERVRHDRGNVQLARQIVLAGVADIDPGLPQVVQFLAQQLGEDRKSTRLNSSH